MWARASCLTRTLIISSGASARWLGLPSEQALIGHGVSSCATCDGFFFAGKDDYGHRRRGFGHGRGAVPHAFATKVTLIHRRSEFRASKIMLDRARKHDKIEFMTDTVVEEVYDPAAKEVTGLRAAQSEDRQGLRFPNQRHVPGNRASRRTPRCLPASSIWMMTDI